MHGRGRDSKVALDVGFGRGTAVELGVEVDEGEVLTLLGGEGACRRAFRDRHLVLTVIWASCVRHGGQHEREVDCRAER